jgi:hypothetical protein
MKFVPFALAELLADLRDGSPDGLNLVGLLAAHGDRLDTHMALESPTRWNSFKGNCKSLHQLTTVMRRCCKAREATDAAIPDDESGGGTSTICYDAGKRHEEKEDRYHPRRLMLFADPQIGKTGAFLGLIEVYLLANERRV